ncbi:DUF99 domain-containing protein [Aphanothece hegewaldii CCALA 016]|uniref:DUF99 domain-containing protein n=1 Tax=Aphanothece hegewaldii CCALA 016 TaxID=2107694 RepID=A0A2T1M3L8_9CHRO|nr:DUF99 family protein [Aphanothece hegewaldii]PSF39412.1 DUF99 domain-containing protein [Aphanothece hegewaldii CCALA 016]
MKLEELLRLRRTIRVIGFDDAPFVRGSGQPVGVAGVICGNTRFEGMLWGEVEADGWDGTEQLCKWLSKSKFLPQLHLILLDGICLGGFNVIDLPLLSRTLNLPCVALMRSLPDLDKMKFALSRLPFPEKRWEILQRAGEIYGYPPFYFQVQGDTPNTIASVLNSLTDRGHVPEALRLAHLIGAAVIKGESGKQA